MRRAAFTLMELLVVVAVIGLLIALIVPSLSAARTRGKIAACASNLHQNCVAMYNYASLNAGSFPQVVGPGGLLFWDVSVSLANLLTANGTSRSIYYCPLAPDQNVNNLWNFPGGNYRVMGYFYFLYRDISNPPMSLPNNTSLNYLDSHFQTQTQGAQDFPYPKHSKSSIIPVGAPDDQELVSDVVIDDQSSVNTINGVKCGDFTHVILRGGQPGEIFSSNHLNGRGTMSSGGNVGFLDGHVEERRLDKMKVRYHVTSDIVNEWF